MICSVSNKKAGFILFVVLLCICLVVISVVTWLEKTESPDLDKNIVHPEVQIPQGRVRGVNLVTHHGRNISGFIGIPYAQPPVGNLRFRAPVPAGSWNGTLDATTDSKPCPQIIEDGTEFIGDEDCLYLNVYTPRVILLTKQLAATEDSPLLPVMLYVFGGAFISGDNNSSKWGPFFLLDKDVILVVPAYRTGVLGYLSTGDEVSLGNYALKDLVQALQWNRDNIQYFGGDPDQVTIFGGSAGATLVEHLTTTPLTNGLFHRVITQSGSSLMPGAQYPRKIVRKRAIQLGEYLGCPTNTSMALVDCLRNLSASRLVDTVEAFPLGGGYFLKYVWPATIEIDIKGALLTDSSANLFAAGKVRDLPWIFLVVRDEGIEATAPLDFDPDVFEQFLNNLDTILPHRLRYGDFVDNVTAYTAALKSYYLNDPTADRDLLMANVTQLLGDNFFTYPVYRSLEQHFTHAKGPQYFCSFEYEGTWSNTYRYRKVVPKNHGVAHGDELLYIFRNQTSFFGPSRTRMSEADLEMVDTMVQLWTSFATTGKPTTLDSSNATIWEPYSSRKNYLRIGNGADNSIQVAYNFSQERMKFWDQLTAATSWA